MRSLFTVLAVLVLVGCEGPAGPMGPEGAQGAQGTQGAQGPPGPSSESILIEQPLSMSAYNETGEIIIRDRRITPQTFRLLYLKLVFEDETSYIPLDYLLLNGVSVSPPEDAGSGTPVLILEDGRLTISDPEMVLFGAALLTFLVGADASMVVLVAV